jgi:hypothetical protein
MNTWELTLAMSAERKIPVIITLPGAAGDNQSIINDINCRFRLDAALAGYVFIDAAEGRGKKSGWPARDKTIMDVADVLIPVSIRSGGNLERMIADYTGKIHGGFTAPYQKSARPRPRYDSFSINPAWRDGEWLVHFTRTSPGPWPDETGYDYYRAVSRSGTEYCRSALVTLRHILEAGIIYGSGRNIRRGRRVVGFTRFSREMCRDLFRYRPRLVNTNFEPCGIAVRQEAAAGLGIRPVRYGPPGLYRKLPDAEKPYFQSAGGDGVRWRGENEWRLVGDFDLSRIPPGIGKAVVPVESDSRLVHIESDMDVWPLFV